MPTGSLAATLTVCIIARDEAERIPAALASVAWADERLVVDSGSTDATVAIAEAAGARVVAHDWAGFGAQRNVALDHARGDWVLELDADERVSPALRRSLQAFLAAPPEDVACCVLPLRHRFLGGPLGPSAKYPAYRVRLIRRGAYRHDEARRVHEGLWPRERTVALTGDIEHELAATWREALGDPWRYARLEAEHVAAPGTAAAVLRAVVLRPAAKAAWRLTVDGGWRDGWRGLVKIGLDAGVDAVIFLRASRHRHEVGEQGFGRVVVRTGPVRLVALVRGNPEPALRWLRAARRTGADVALVTWEAVPPEDGLHVQRLDGRGPLAVLRALDAVGQMRPVDRLVLPPRTARWLLPLLTVTTRGALPPVGLNADPEAAVAETVAESRS